MGTTNSHSEKLGYSEIISFPLLCFVLFASKAHRSGRTSSVQEHARGHSSVPEKEKSVSNVNGSDKSSLHPDSSNDDYVDVPIYTPSE
jgi:hypothetical protein